MKHATEGLGDFGGASRTTLGVAVRSRLRRAVERAARDSFEAGKTTLGVAVPRRLRRALEHATTKGKWEVGALGVAVQRCLRRALHGSSSCE